MSPQYNEEKMIRGLTAFNIENKGNNSIRKHHQHSKKTPECMDYEISLRDIN